MSKGVLIAEVVENKTSFFSLLGGGGLITKKEALQIIENVANGYDGGPQLAEQAEIFFVEGKKFRSKSKRAKRRHALKRKRSKKRTQKGSVKQSKREIRVKWIK